MVIKMKKIALILVLVMCCAMLFSCGEPEARDILDADGNVVAVGYYDGDKLLYEEKSDTKGNLAQKTTYDDDGRVEKVEDYAIGFLSGETEYTYTDTDGSYTVVSTTYDNQGEVRLVTETTYENDVPVSQTSTVPVADGESSVEESTFTYNDDGSVLEIIMSGDRKIREILTDGNGVVIYDHEFFETGASAKTFYNADSVIIKIENFTAEGELLVTIVNEYDDDGVLKKTYSYDKDSQLKDYSEYIYENGTLLAIYKYNSNNTINTSIIYDENGKATIYEGQYVPLQ